MLSKLSVMSMSTLRKEMSQSGSSSHETNLTLRQCCFLEELWRAMCVPEEVWQRMTPCLSFRDQSVIKASIMFAAQQMTKDSDKLSIDCIASRLFAMAPQVFVEERERREFLAKLDVLLKFSDSTAETFRIVYHNQTIGAGVEIIGLPLDSYGVFSHHAFRWFPPLFYSQTDIDAEFGADSVHPLASRMWGTGVRGESELFLGLVGMFNECCQKCKTVLLYQQVDMEEWEGGTILIYFEPSLLERVGEDLHDEHIPAVFRYTSDERSLNTRCASCSTIINAFGLSTPNIFDLIRLTALSAYKQAAGNAHYMVPSHFRQQIPSFGDNNGADDYIIASGLTQIVHNLMHTFYFVEYPFAVYLGPFRYETATLALAHELKDCTEKEVDQVLYFLICEVVQTYGLSCDATWRNHTENHCIRGLDVLLDRQRTLANRGLRLLQLYPRVTVIEGSFIFVVKLLFLIRILAFVLRVASPNDYVILQGLWRRLRVPLTEKFPVLTDSVAASDLWMLILLGECFASLDLPPFQ